MMKIPLPKSRAATFLVIAFFMSSIINWYTQKPEIDRIKGLRKLIPNQIIGYQFEALAADLENVQYLGYFTDKDLEKDDAAAKLFSYAQYILAPSVLELNDLSHRYILFVCSKESIAWDKIKELNLEPYRRNKYGMVLARKRR